MENNLSKQNDDINTTSFEQYIAIIHECLEKLEQENIALHESMRLYKEGIDAINQAQKLLEDAKIECQSINASKDEK